MKNLLNSAPLYYPSAKEWMWTYCIYLGPFTDSKGHNYDLGIFIDDDMFEISDATVYGNDTGQYMSGPINRPEYVSMSETKQEVVRRAKELKLIP